MKRILIIQTAFLGDVIIATPVISELKRVFPATEIDVLVKKGNESLLANNPKINHVYTFDKKSGKYKSIFRLIKTFRANKYNLVVNIHRFGSSGLIAGLSRGKMIVGFKKNPFSFLYHKKVDHQIGDGTHEVTRNLSLIGDYTEATLIRPELFVSTEQINQIEPYKTGEYFCLSPASVWFTKQLPKEKWVELIHKLGNAAPIYLLGATNDYQLCEEIISMIQQDNVVNLCGKLELLASAALMQSAKRCYVNDSGPLHLASAVNAPVTAFFCSTILDFGFGPLSEDQQVLEVANLECRPCGLHGHSSCPKGHFKCGTEINLAELI